MSKKIILLIVASIIGLIALSLIQGYLIKNTYSLKKEAFISKTKKEIDNIDDHGSPIDSIYDILSDRFINELDNYTLKTISKKRLLNRLRIITDSLNSSFITEFEKAINQKKLHYNLKYHKILKNIVVIDSLHKDTIFKGNKLKPYRLIGYEFKSKAALLTGNSTIETERTFEKKINKKQKTGKYRLYFETENYINIDDWNVIVFNQMKALLFCSISIFLFVIGVLYYSIVSLISQKKIADIKTDFVNNITHELKTPLSTLSLATKILKKEDVINQSKSIKSTLETIERQHIKLQKLIDQVLNNSLGYKEIILKKETIQINKYLHNVLDDFEVSLSNNTILTRDIPELKQLIILDKFYVNTAIINILENGVKYGGENIVISAMVNQKALEIKIKDNGIGISKKDQKLLFDKFFRVQNKDLHDVKGLGLGLYYSYQIVKAHQGTILVDSEKNRGTTFTLKLPLM